MRVVVIQHILLSSSTSPSASGAWTERQVERRAARGLWCSRVRARSHLNTRIATGSSLRFFFLFCGSVRHSRRTCFTSFFFSKTSVRRFKTSRVDCLGLFGIRLWEASSKSGRFMPDNKVVKFLARGDAAEVKIYELQ